MAKKSQARKTSTVPTRIWSFGALAPTEGSDHVNQQLKLGFDYYNKRVEIENEGREEYRAARRKAFPAYEALEAKKAELDKQIEENEDAIRECRRKAAAENPSHIIRLNPKELQATSKRLKSERKVVSEKLKTEREKINTNKSFNASIKAGRDARYEEFKRHRREDSGCYTEIYKLVDEAFKPAKKSATDPKPKRGSGIEGRIGVQINSGNCPLSTEEFLSGSAHTFLRLEPTKAGEAIFAPTQWDTRSGRRAARATVCLRVGSDGRKPIWAKFPVLIHRKLPEGQIRWAWVNVYKVGTRLKYELQLVIESKTFAELPKGRGVVAVSIGWSTQADGGIVVGEGMDDQGNKIVCEIPGESKPSKSMPRGAVNAIRFPDLLQNHADHHFNAARDVLARELKAGVKVPTWLSEEAQTLPHWRSASRLARIAGRWTAEMFPERERVENLWGEWKMVCLAEKVDLFAEEDEVAEDAIRSWFAERGLTPTETLCLYLEWWRRKNKHLYQWACDQRERARAHRDEIFKIFASKLAKTYETIVLRDINWANIARKSTPEANREVPQGVRTARQIAAPGTLEAAIVSAVGKTRIEFVTYQSDTKIDPDAETSDEKTGSVAHALLDLYFSGQGQEAAE